MLPYSSQICSAIDMIIKHISIEFLGSEFHTLKKTFQGSKQLWRWARTRSSHGGKAWRLAAANKNNKYVTSLRRKHFLFCSPNFQCWNMPLYQFGNCLHFRGYYWCIYLKSFQYLNLSMFIFSWKLKGTCCTSVVLKKTLLLTFRIYVQSTPPQAGVKPIFSVTRKFDPRSCP